MLTENQLETGRRSLIQSKLQETSLGNRVGQKKKRRGIKTGLLVLEGICERGWVHLGKPLPWEPSAYQEVHWDK